MTPMTSQQPLDNRGPLRGPFGGGLLAPSEAPRGPPQMMTRIERAAFTILGFRV